MSYQYVNVNYNKELLSNFLKSQSSEISYDNFIKILSLLNKDEICQYLNISSNIVNSLFLVTVSFNDAAPYINSKNYDHSLILPLDVDNSTELNFFMPSGEVITTPLTSPMLIEASWYHAPQRTSPGSESFLSIGFIRSLSTFNDIIPNLP